MSRSEIGMLILKVHNQLRAFENYKPPKPALSHSLWELNITNGFHDRPFTHAPSSCTLRTPGDGSEGRHFKSAATSLNYSPDRGKHYRLLCSTLPPGPAPFYHPPATLKCWRCEAENLKFLAFAFL